MLLDLTNKRYLVVGASSGIGRDIAISISKLNGKVVLVSRKRENLEETLSLMNGTGHIVMPFDLSNVSEIKEFIKEKGGSYNGKI